MKKKILLPMLLIAGLMIFAAGCGCGQTNNNNNNTAEETQAAYRDDVSTADIVAAVKAQLGENYWPDTDIPAEYLEATYGVSADMYEEVTAQMPMISVNVDTLIIVKAKADQVANVEEALNNYRDFSIEDAMQYPMNLGKVQASEIKTFGNYVCFVQLGAETNMDADTETIIKDCQKDNNAALAAVENELTK